MRSQRTDHPGDHVGIGRFRKHLVQLGGEVRLALLVLDELAAVFDVPREVAVRVVDVLHVGRIAVVILGCAFAVKAGVVVHLGAHGPWSCSRGNSNGGNDGGSGRKKP